MAVTAGRIASAHRPAAVTVTIGLLWFLAVTAAAGGIALLFGAAAPDEEWLDSVPVIDTWVIPGLVLGIGFGLGSAVVAYGLQRTPHWEWLGWLEDLTVYHWSWAATIAVGVGHAVWIGLEFAYLPEYSILQYVYGSIAIALMLIPFLPAMRRHLRITA